MTARCAAYPGVDEFETFACSALSARLKAESAVETPLSEENTPDIFYNLALATIDWLTAALETLYVPPRTSAVSC
jgi:hypothetical protein